MLLKAVSIILGISFTFSVFASDGNTTSQETPDRCFYSSDQFQFNGVHVSPNGSTSYVVNSYVSFYSHDGTEVPPDMYKGRLAVEDEDGMTYEICIRGGDMGAIEKIEASHSARSTD